MNFCSKSATSKNDKYPLTPNHQSIFVWQWNCRGFTKKRGLLTQYLGSLQRKPDIILLQETMGAPHISQYTTYAPLADEGNKVNIATLITETLTAQEPQFYQEKGITAIIVSIPPLNPKREMLQITNVYSPPRAYEANFNKVSEHAIEKGVTSLIAGDLNAPHTSWGYSKTSSKGRKLKMQICNAGYTTLNNVNDFTR